MTNKIKKLDLHGCNFYEAELEIIKTAEECLLKGISTLEIVHGYRHGSVIKDNLTTSAFKSKLKKNGILLTTISKMEGSTTFRVLDRDLISVKGENIKRCPECGEPLIRGKCDCRYNG